MMSRTSIVVSEENLWAATSDVNEQPEELHEEDLEVLHEEDQERYPHVQKRASNIIKR
jgi:hypothetical protein